MLYTQVYNNTKVDQDLAASLIAMPKTELHVHLEGALSPEFVLGLAKRNGVNFPASSVEEWQRFCSFTDFDHFLDCFRITTECLIQPVDFAEAVEDFLRNQAAQNIVYSEVSLSGILHLSKMPVDELVDALAEGIHSGEKKYGSHMKLVFDLSRDVVRGQPEMQAAILDFALRGRSKGICAAIGMGGRETGNQPELFTDIYAEARRNGLHVIAHAGETEGSEFVRDSVDLLHVERIGHGIRVLDDQELTRRMAEIQMPFEVSPQSNYCTRVVPLDQPHPIRRMLDAGLLCTVNSDDPAMFSTSLHNEYLTLAAQGFSFDELKQLCQNGFDVAFSDLSGLK